MWQIVIIMFMSLHSELDALEVTHHNGEPLEFATEDSCYEHVAEHIVSLRAFAAEQFPDVPIKSINCFRKHSTI
jgi:hypothetical protein